MRSGLECPRDGTACELDSDAVARERHTAEDARGVCVFAAWLVAAWVIGGLTGFWLAGVVL